MFCFFVGTVKRFDSLVICFSVAKDFIFGFLKNPISEQNKLLLVIVDVIAVKNFSVF